uniref:Uncharacterized protein n=1 Tax=Anguilla anguilla TaxID=7936 RepID=A0A0E9PL67_ANGAN
MNVYGNFRRSVNLIANATDCHKTDYFRR